MEGLYSDEIKEYEKLISDNDKKISEVIDKISELESYTGGDMTGTEYVKHIELGSLYSELGRLNDQGIMWSEILCAIKIKRNFASFFGKIAAEELFDEKNFKDTQTMIRGIFSEIKNLPISHLNDALDDKEDKNVKVSKFEPIIRIFGEKENGDQYDYEIVMGRNGLKLNDNIEKGKEKDD